MTILQMSVDAQCRSANQRRACGLIERAAELDPVPEVVCLPARCNCGVLPAEPQSLTAAMTDSFLGALAARTREMGVSLVLGYCETAGGQLYDAVAWCDADSDVLAGHRRQASAAGETDAMRRGHRACVAQTLYGTMGLLAGEDVCNPDVLESVVQDGAAAVFAPCQWTASASMSERLCASARDHRVWLIVANGVGDGVGDGQSRIIDPAGEVVCHAAAGREQLLSYDIALEMAEP